MEGRCRKYVLVFALGLMTGLLVAPTRGRELRRKLRRELVDLIEYLVGRRI